MRVTWAVLKSFVDARKLSIQWVDMHGHYWLKAFDDIFTLESTINKNIASSDLTDFETNYKSLGNKKINVESTDIHLAYISTSSTSRAPIRSTSYIEQTTNAQRSISSTSVNDTSAGTGAIKVKICYLTANFEGPYEEVVTLNGLTAVNTVATNICFIEKMEVLDVGSLGGNDGTIRIHTALAGGGSVFASIAAGDNRTFYSHHYIPNGKTMHLMSLNASAITTGYRIDGTKTPYSIPTGTPKYAAYSITSQLNVPGDASPLVLTFPKPFIISGPAKFEVFCRPQSISLGNLYVDFTYYDK